MKTNIDRMYVYPEFKRLIKIEAASKGKDIIEYTEDLVKEKKLENAAMESLVASWNKKYKRTNNDRLDFF